MKRWLIPLGTVVVVAIAILLVSDRAKTAEPVKPTQWEYKVMHYNELRKLSGRNPNDLGDHTHFELGLNKLAEDGWDLVTVTTYGNSGDKNFYLKRPKAR